MNLQIVVEGPTDEQILRRFLTVHWADRLSSLVVKQGGGDTASAARARTILDLRQDPVLLVLDQDGQTDSDQREYLEWYFGGHWSDDRRFRVVVFQPTIERLAFIEPCLVTQVFGKPLEIEQRIRAEYEPKRVLESLCRGQNCSLTDFWVRAGQLSDSTWKEIEQHSPELQSVHEFVDQCLSVPA